MADPSRLHRREPHLPGLLLAELHVGELVGGDQDAAAAGVDQLEQRGGIGGGRSDRGSDLVGCLLGLEQNYGLEFKSFTPVDIGLRYEVLDKGQADLSIVFTTDAQLGASDKYTTLEDDKGVLPAGNVVFLTKKQTAEQAGSDYESTITEVQSGLTEKVMQELDARVDIDKEKPADVAHDYLKASGYIE